MHTFTTPQGTLEYRTVGSGNKVVVIFPGGHMSASVKLGEDFFTQEGYRVIVLSRPGYGKTSLAPWPSPDAFAGVVVKLLDDLGIHKIVVLGISAGGRNAIRLAAMHSNLVEKLILQSATSFMPWPDAHTRRIASVAFNPFMEKFTWWIMRHFLRVRPQIGLRMMLSSMTTLEPSKIVGGLNKEQSEGLIYAFSRLQSGKGFINDLKQTVGSAKDVHMPTLIIHSKYDKSVSLDHAKRLHVEIEGSKLFVSTAESHMIWFSDQYVKVQDEMRVFLGSQVPEDDPGEV